MMLIAIDRYLLIVCPMRPRISTRLAIISVVIVTLVSILVMSPMAFYSSYVVIDDAALGLHLQYCTEAWGTRKVRVIYSFIAVFSQYVVPLLVIGVLYTLVFRRVKRRMQKMKSRRTKTTKMLVAVVVVFAISWTPWHVYILVAEVDYSIVKGRYFKLIDVLLRVMAMSSSCVNPFLYGWFNDNYRNAFLGMLNRKKSHHPKIIRDDSLTETRRSVTQYTRNRVRSSAKNGKENGSNLTHGQKETVVILPGRVSNRCNGAHLDHTDSTRTLLESEDDLHQEMIPLCAMTPPLDTNPPDVLL